MKNTLLALLFFSTTAAAIDNKTYVCSSDDQQRIIEIQYPGETSVPCQVVYTKDGESNILWQAMNQTGYCEEQADAFADKQSSWGWQCSDSSSAPEQDTATTMDADVPQAADNPTEENTASEESAAATPITPAAPANLELE